MATRDITDSFGQKYKLLELTTSGTLTIDKTVKAEICAVAGGQDGTKAGYDPSSPYSYYENYSGIGGVGGVVINTCAVITVLDVVVGGVAEDSTVKRNGETSYIANTAATIDGNSWGSGSGSGIRIDTSYSDPKWYPSNKGTMRNSYKGNGMTGYVFNDTSVYDFPLGSGGGGGAYRYLVSGTANYTANGFNGGENGENTSQTVSTGGTTGGTGGRGAGNGGDAVSTSAEACNGADATHYGCGGGGGGRFYYTSYGTVVNDYYGEGGKGKQGVIFIRIPY